MQESAHSSLVTLDLVGRGEGLAMKLPVDADTEQSWPLSVMLAYNPSLTEI